MPTPKSARATAKPAKPTATKKPVMGMMNNINADTPDEYLAALSGWRQALVTTLRGAVLRAAPKALEEQIKWGHLVYFHNGPVLLIRAEDARVLFGFWRGQRLREIEPRLKPGGKYEMATLEFREDDKIAAAVVKKLVTEAVALNKKLGNPAVASTAAKKQ
jgi:hypothetical protein